MSELLTPKQLADMLGKGEPFVAAKARSKAWPHVKLGRSVRFTPDQVAQIVAACTIEPSEKAKAAGSWGRRGRRTA